MADRPRWSRNKTSNHVNRELVTANRSKRHYQPAQLQPCPICWLGIPTGPGLPEVHPTCGSAAAQLVQISDAALARAGVDMFS
jgi:hypothetical protein